MPAALLWIVAYSFAITASFAQEIYYPPSVAMHQARLPQAVQYAIVFHQAATFKDLADTFNSQGKDRDSYKRHLSHKFGLTSRQLTSLEIVAVQYREDVKQTNQKLEASIVKFHEQVGQLPAGTPMLPPPSEARSLIAQRDAIALRARDHLHRLVGDKEFARIDTVITALETPLPGTPKTRRPVSDRPDEAGAYGYTSEFYDPNTKVVTAYSETNLYGAASYYYEAGLILRSNDRSVAGISQPGGFAQATLTYQDTEGANHYVQGTHSALMLDVSRRLKWNDYYGLQQWPGFDVLASDAFDFTEFERASDESNEPYPLGATFLNGR